MKTLANAFFLAVLPLLLSVALLSLMVTVFPRPNLPESFDASTLRSYRASMIIVFHDWVNYETVGKPIDETDLPIGLSVWNFRLRDVPPIYQEQYYLERYRGDIPQTFLAKYGDKVEFVDHSIDHGYLYGTTGNVEWMDWSFNEWPECLHNQTGRATYGYLGPYFIEPRSEALASNPSAKYVIGYISESNLHVVPIYGGRYCKFYAHTLSFDDYSLDDLKQRFLKQRERGCAMVTMCHPHTLDNEYTKILDFLLWVKTYQDVWISLPHIQAEWHLFRFKLERRLELAQDKKAWMETLYSA